VAAILLLSATFLSAYNVAGRVLFSASLTWIEEFSCYAAGFIMFFMMPYLEYNDRHLSIAFLEESFKAKGNLVGRKIIFYIRGAITVFAFCILARAGYHTFTRNFAIDAKSPTMELPYGILYLILFVCIILVLFVWAFHFFLKDWSQKGGEEIEFD